MSLHGSAVDILTEWVAPDPAQDSLRHAVLAFLAARPDGCLRACVPGHVTASALVLDHTGTQAVLTLHPRFGRWLQVGGHCEPDDQDVVAAALREATEESGVEALVIDAQLAAVHVHPVTCSLGVPTRHIHSHVGLLSLDDVEHCIELVMAVVQQLDRATVESFTAV